MQLRRAFIGQPPSRSTRLLWLLLTLTLISAIGAETPRHEPVAAPQTQPAKVDDVPLTFAQITDAHLFDEGKKRDSKEGFDRDQQDNRAALHWAVGKINDIVNHGRTIDFAVFTGDFGLEFVRDPNERAPCSDPEDKDFKKYKVQGWPGYVPLKDAANQVTQEFSRLQVSTIYVLPGNNDLVGEDPCDLWRYSKFVELVAGAVPGGRAKIVDLVALHQAAVRGFRLVGLNSASFKGAKNDALEQLKQLGIILDEDSEKSENPKDTVYLIFTHIPDLDDPYTFKPAWYSGIDRTGWQTMVARQNVAGIFAGHFHSSERLLYATPASDTPLSIDRSIAEKTWVAPPLAMKNQDDKAETARGFLLVRVQRVAGGNGPIATVSATPFWYVGPRPAMCWCYILPILAVLGALVLLLWGVYAYVTVKKRRPDLVRDTHPTLLTLAGLAALALVVRQVMRFMIGDFSLAAMYWETPIFGAIGGIFASLGEANAFALASYEGPTSIKAGVLGDIVTGIGGSIAVVFVSERTLQLKPDDPESLLWLASVSFIAGAAGRKLVQMALQRFFKQLAEVEKKFDEKLSGVERQVRAATNQASDAHRVAQQALDKTAAQTPEKNPEQESGTTDDKR